MLKEKKKKQRISRYFIPVVLVIYISISHVLLPIVNKKDFLFFFRWHLFSSMPAESIYDITWDGGKTFLLRDHRQKAKKTGIDLHTLLPLLLRSNTERLKNDFYQTLLDFCNCKNLNIFKLKGSLSEHILYEKQLKVLEQRKL